MTPDHVIGPGCVTFRRLNPIFTQPYQAGIFHDDQQIGLIEQPGTEVDLILDTHHYRVYGRRFDASMALRDEHGTSLAELDVATVTLTYAGRHYPIIKAALANWRTRLQDDQGNDLIRLLVGENRTDLGGLDILRPIDLGLLLAIVAFGTAGLPS